MIKRIDCDEIWFNNLNICNDVNHNEYSSYTHDEVMKQVIPYIRSDITIIGLDRLDFITDEIPYSLMKFRFRAGSCFYQEMAMKIDQIINHMRGSKLIYYNGDRLPTMIRPEESSSIIVNNFYLLVI